MIPTIFFNRTCKKCADGTIVSAKISQDTENNILITYNCPDTTCTEEFISKLQAEKIEYFLYAAFYLLKNNMLIESVINFSIAHECLLLIGTEILANNESSCKKSKLSERVIGAFVALYKKVCNPTDKDIKDFDKILAKTKSLRNKCVHEGLIPTKDEVMEHGEEIYNNIVQIFSNIQNTPEYKDWRVSKLFKSTGYTSIRIFNDSVFFVDKSNQKSFQDAYKSFLQNYKDIGSKIKIEYNPSITTIVLDESNIITKEQYKKSLESF